MNTNRENSGQPERELDSKNNFKLYKILIEVLRSLHTQWIDNFRIILTFNSILLPGTLALFVFIAKGEVKQESLVSSYLLVGLISFIGILVTLVGIFIIRRINAIKKLRQKQLRKLESDVCKKTSVAPFCEGYKLMIDGEPSDCKDMASFIDDVEPMKFRKVDAFWGYTIISLAFIVAYTLLLIFSLKGIFNNC